MIMTFVTNANKEKFEVYGEYETSGVPLSESIKVISFNAIDVLIHHLVTLNDGRKQYTDRAGNLYEWSSV
jgi:hypothetical protein